MSARSARWLPAAPQPSDWKGPWAGRDRLCKREELVLYSDRFLAGAVQPVLDASWEEATHILAVPPPPPKSLTLLKDDY